MRKIKLKMFGLRFFNHQLLFLAWLLMLLPSLAFPQAEGGSGIYDLLFWESINKEG